MSALGFDWNKIPILKLNQTSDVPSSTTSLSNLLSTTIKKKKKDESYAETKIHRASRDETRTTVVG